MNSLFSFIWPDKVLFFTYIVNPAIVYQNNGIPEFSKPAVKREALSAQDCQIVVLLVSVHLLFEKRRFQSIESGFLLIKVSRLTKEILSVKVSEQGNGGGIPTRIKAVGQYKAGVTGQIGYC